MGLSLRQLARLLLRVGVAAAGAGTLVGLASLGMLMTTQGRALSLLVEPLSLLYLPGIAVALVWTSILGHLQHHVKSIADNHDFSSAFVVWCTFAFYFVVLLRRLLRPGRKAALTTSVAAR